MKNDIKFILTVDTEWDRNQSKREITVKNIERLNVFQKMCNHYGIKPTYLCTFEVIKSREFDRFISAQHGKHKFEIGAHLHPWSNPPFMDIDQLGITPYPTEYPYDILGDKINNLVSEISKRYPSPRSYRAGRFAFSPKHIPILKDLGIMIDSSVTPNISWKNVMGYKTGGSDFLKYQVSPYFWSEDGSILEKPHSNTILEVPITILSTSKSSICWLRPFPNISFKKLKMVFEQGLRYKLPVLVMFLHSNELHESFNPYFNSESKNKYSFSLLEKIFIFLSEYSIDSLTLSEFGDMYIMKNISYS